jgi:hypothetical protein
MNTTAGRGRNSSALSERERDTLRNNLYNILRTRPDRVVESELDRMRYDNSDMSLDDAVERNGGQFFPCNADVLSAKW